MPNGESHESPAPAGNILTRKIGPFPVWVYAAVAAGAVTVVLLYRRGQPAAMAPAPASSDLSGQLQYPPTVVVTPSSVANVPASSDTGTATGTGTAPAQAGNATTRQSGPGGVWDQTYGGISVRQSPDPNSQVIGFIPFGSTFQVGSPVQGGQAALYWWDPVRQVTTKTWYPVEGGGPKGYVSSLDVVLQNLAGLGGAGATAVLQHFAPFVPTQYAQTGMGGLSELARRTGVPLTRLQAGNYHLRGRNGYGPGVARIA